MAAAASRTRPAVFRSSLVGALLRAPGSRSLARPPQESTHRSAFVHLDHSPLANDVATSRALRGPSLRLWVDALIGTLLWRVGSKKTSAAAAVSFRVRDMFGQRQSRLTAQPQVAGSCGSWSWPPDVPLSYSRPARILVHWPRSSAVRHAKAHLGVGARRRASAWPHSPSWARRRRSRPCRLVSVARESLDRGTIDHENLSLKTGPLGHRPAAVYAGILHAAMC